MVFGCSQAVRTSIYGRPGACYVDIAGDMVNAKEDRSKVRFVDTYATRVGRSLVCLQIQSIVFVLQSCVLLFTSSSQFG